MADIATAEIPGDRSLLIVEDDKSFLQRLARAMEQRGFTVTTADTVADGLVQVERTAPAFAVVDMRLADGNGLEVISALKQRRPEARGRNKQQILIGSFRDPARAGVGERMEAAGGGVREAQRHAPPGRGREPVLGRLAHDRGGERVGQDQAGVLGKDRERHGKRRREEQPIAMHPVIQPFAIGAEILDRGFDLDDPDVARAVECDEVGAPPGR
jgi:CheY-like chemotaxis protein